MTNEEILANAPEGADYVSATTSFEYVKYDVTWSVYDTDTESWFPHGHKTPYGLRSLSDIRRIVELEKQLTQFAKDEMQWRVDTLRHKERAEAAERERDDREVEITVLEALLSNLWPENYKPMNIVVEELTEQLRQQLNGGE